MSFKVLIVDDEPDICEILAIHVRNKGWITQTASDGSQALQAIPAFEPHVIVSDINMPVIDGLEMLENLRDQKNNTPVIFVTGFQDLAKLQRAWAAGAFDMIEKPFSKNQLLILIENALEYGRDYVEKARRRASFLKN